MEQALYRWIDEVAWDISFESPSNLASLVAKFDMKTRAARPIGQELGRSLPSSVFRGRAADETLVFADFLIAEIERSGGHSYQIPQLTSVLSQAGSEWTVSTRGASSGLVKRVPEGVQLAADAASQLPGEAGRLLSEAWHAAFGRVPNPSEAYSKAIKAVESSASAVVTPSDQRSTLGKIAQVMRDQGNWELPLEDDPANSSTGVVYSMVRALWSGQSDRHGGNGHRSPTGEEAEAAVLLAVPLVQWFASGAVSRR